jgi:hypothetical protein
MAARLTAEAKAMMVVTKHGQSQEDHGDPMGRAAPVDEAAEHVGVRGALPDRFRHEAEDPADRGDRGRSRQQG